MDLKLEVIGIPVSNVDAAKAFYTEQVGFGLDHDISPGEGRRVLVVEDIDSARAALALRGVQISEVQQLGPEGAPGSRFAFFTDPDGNGWSLQEIKRS